eukprot:GEMP01013760.1.p1 GENE.GEMP01013760.1~~GEMP01013760.1.p1  ORF type:complete len:668 (+),score=186.58 GEMP01013760.1:155-2158(+)
MHLIYNATGKDIIVTAFGRRRKLILYQIPFMTSRRISAVSIHQVTYLNDDTPTLLDVRWQFDIVVYSEPHTAAPQCRRYDEDKHKEVVHRVVDAECDIHLLAKMEQMVASTGRNQQQMQRDSGHQRRGTVAVDENSEHNKRSNMNEKHKQRKDNDARLWTSHSLQFFSRTTRARVGDHYDALAATHIRRVVDSNRGGENANHGFVFEEQQASSFNSRAIRTGAEVRARVVPGTGPTDIHVTVDNTIVHNVQLKAYKTPAATKRAVNKSKAKYPQNDLFVVPMGHQLEGHSHEALEVAGIRSEPITREGLTVLRDNSRAMEHTLRSLVERQDRRIVANASILGLVIGGSIAVLAEIPRAQQRLQGRQAMERLVADCVIPHRLLLANGDGTPQQKGQWRQIVATVVAFVFGEEISSWRRAASHVTLPGAKGAGLGLSVGYALSKTGVYATRTVAALEAAQTTSKALPVVRAVGSNLNFILVGATIACDIGSILWASHCVHRRALGRALVGATLRGTIGVATTAVACLPVYGGRVALIGGIAYALTEAFFGCTTRCTDWILPLTDEERDFNVAQFRKRTLQQALTLLKLNWAGLFDPTLNDSEQRIAEATRRAKRDMRQWMRALHPDRNDGRQHVMFHNIMAACAIVLAEIQQKPVEVSQVLELTDTFVD